MVDKNHISTGLEHYTSRLIVLLYVMRLRVVVMMVSFMGDIFIMSPRFIVQVLHMHIILAPTANRLNEALRFGFKLNVEWI